ncbi:uncharacterized protein G2W53_034790 [Senna tora]|uniref:RNase H type-1 domain-containing protein n=1 Tax=Senna tora TaxID=362788 RepID=A0A834WE30_9FABA|nr:uncharacterized protein G2W53_034790 [Senna tora]
MKDSSVVVLIPSHLCACSFILCDDHGGALLTGSTRKFWASSPLVAEALALREGLNACSNLDSDFKMLIDYLTLCIGFLDL